MIPRMKMLHVIAMFGLPAIGFSQWVHYPTDGVPRKADGAPDLTAPAPRLADGKPDFSGIWHTAGDSLARIQLALAKEDPEIR